MKKILVFLVMLSIFTTSCNNDDSSGEETNNCYVVESREYGVTEEEITIKFIGQQPVTYSRTCFIHTFGRDYTNIQPDTELCIVATTPCTNG